VLEMPDRTPPPRRDPLSRKPLSDRHVHAAKLYRELNRIFLSEFRKTMPVQYIDAFLLVVIEEGLSVNDYAERAGVSKSVMSRHLLDIGDFTRDHQPGFGLVTSRPHPFELRRHEILLTPVGRANAYNVKDDYDRAIADYDRAIRLDPNNPFPYNGRGSAYDGKKDYARAIADYDQAIRLDPKYAKAYYGRGRAKLKSGDTAGGNADIAIAHRMMGD
jgi:tetratricopeptide (TPR) repeat protein